MTERDVLSVQGESWSCHAGVAKARNSDISGIWIRMGPALLPLVPYEIIMTFSTKAAYFIQ